jgi:Helix-turn-helix domain
MSCAIEWAWKQQLPSTPKFVLVALADYAGSKPDYTCWPSFRTIAKKCCLSIRAVRYAIDDLIASKFLRIIGIHEWGTPIYQLAVGRVLECSAGSGRMHHVHKVVHKVHFSTCTTCHLTTHAHRIELQGASMRKSKNGKRNRQETKNEAEYPSLGLPSTIFDRFAARSARH